MAKKKRRGQTVLINRKALESEAWKSASQAVADYHGKYGEAVDELSALRSKLNKDLVAAQSEMPRFMFAPRCGVNLPLVGDLPAEVETPPQKTEPKRKKAKKKVAKKKAGGKGSGAGGMIMSDRVREYLGKHPRAGPKEIRKALQKYGVTTALASNVKSRLKKAGRLR